MKIAIEVEDEKVGRTIYAFLAGVMSGFHTNGIDLTVTVDGEEGEPQRIPLDSSNIREISYDPTTKELSVWFGDKEIPYIYSGVDTDVYKEFCEAESPGSYFASVIKPNCEVRRGS